MTQHQYLKNVTTLTLDSDKCSGCGMCRTVCPHGVFGHTGGKAIIEVRDACMECGACARNCRDGALFVTAGVGCANAVINAAIGRSGACDCDCSC